MRKGIFRIISGFILIILQILSYIGNSLQEDNSYYYTSKTTSKGISFYDILFFVWDNIPIILGVFLLIFGFKAFNSRETATVVLHSYNKKSFSITKIVFLFLIMFLFVLRIFDSFNNYFFGAFDFLNLLFSLITLICIVFYLTFYINKKPCYLFSCAILFRGVYYIYNGIISFSNIIYFKEYECCFLAVYYCDLLLGILYIFLAIKLYKEKFSILFIKILSCSSFVIFLISNIIQQVLNFIIIDYVLSPISILINLILPAFFFVYTFVFCPSVKNKGIKDNIKINNDNKIANNIESSYKKPQLSTLNNIELCPICSANISLDNETCHVCGADIAR